MNDEKIESMNLHGAYISAVSAGRSLKQKRDKAAKQVEEDDTEEKKGGGRDHPQMEEVSSQFDSIVLNFDDSCPNCNRNLYSEEIFGGWKKSFQEYVTGCPNCKQNFVSRLLKFQELKTKENSLKVIEIMENHQKTIPVNLFSPIVVRKELENIIHHIGGKSIFSVLLNVWL